MVVTNFWRLLGVGACLLSACAQQEQGAASQAAPPVATAPAAPTRDQMLSATISGIFESPVTLEAGRYDGPAPVAGGASHPTLVLWEPTILFRDIDGQPGNEGIALLSVNTGGSGEFVHVGLFGTSEGQATTMGVAPVGDRARLFRAWVEHGQVHMDVIEAGPADAACCPTQLARKAYAWKDGKLELASNEVVGALSINLLAATDWVLVAMDGQPLPEGTMPPTALIQYGKAAGFAGCNRYTGPLTESQPGSIKIGDLALTSKACDGPTGELEAAFLDRLGKTESYSFQAGQLLLAGSSAGQAARTLLFTR